jgi:hypothetical protein
VDDVTRLPQAMFRLRDQGPVHEQWRYEVELAVDGTPVLGYGPTPWCALRELLVYNQVEFNDARACADRAIDAFLLLGDWRVNPEGELIGLSCMVLRNAERVPDVPRPPRIAMPDDDVEVRELARWVVQRWWQMRGAGS